MYYLLYDTINKFIYKLLCSQEHTQLILGRTHHSQPLAVSIVVRTGDGLCTCTAVNIRASSSRKGINRTLLTDWHTRVILTLEDGRTPASVVSSYHPVTNSPYYVG